jgi:hypothetical protein
VSEATAPPSRASSAGGEATVGEATVGEALTAQDVAGEGANQRELRMPGQAHTPAHARHPEGAARGTCRPWELVVTFLAFLGLALALFHAAWAHPFSTQIGGAGDADEYDWFLSWMPFALGHAHDPLISHYVNFPSGINLMWNTSVILPSLLVSPLTVAFGATFSYNLLATLAPALSAFFAYVAFRRWTGMAPAFAGALVFGYSSYMVAQSQGHLAQTLLMSAPVFLILLDRLLAVQRGSPRLEGAALGLLAWAQILTGEEILALEAVVAAIALVALCAISWQEVSGRVRYALRGAGAAAVVFVVLSAPFLAVQFLGPYRVQSPHPQDVYLSDLLNFVVPTNMIKLAPKAALHISAHFSGNGVEQGAYLGIPIVALIFLTLVIGRRHKVTWVAFVAGASAAILSLGQTLHIHGRDTGIPMPFDVLAKIGPYKNVLPDRFASIMTLFAGMLLALGLEELHRLRRFRLPALAGGWAACVVGLAFLFPITNYPASFDPLYNAYVGGLACPGGSNNKAHPPVALVMPATNELNLRWIAESNFCFMMPSDTGMTGTNSGDVGLQNVMLTAGNVLAKGPLVPPLTPEVREEAALFIHDLDIQEIVVAPEAPTQPLLLPSEQAALVNWVVGLTGQQPAQSCDLYRSYIWKHLPPWSDIASGHVAAAPPPPPNAKCTP